jgi:hypothetical protein
MLSARNAYLGVFKFDTENVRQEQDDLVPWVVNSGSCDVACDAVDELDLAYEKEV